MRPIYFAHGYREREAPFAAYFTNLMRKLGLMPSLDPPSNDVNSAKLERHLRFTDGLVAVLSAREGSASPHILYEISMALRVGKPALVFVEDTLPDNYLSQYIIQCRFSPRSYVREVREHIHALEAFCKYLGENPLPRYRPSGRQRSCLVLGDDGVDVRVKDALSTLIKSRGYKAFRPTSRIPPIPVEGVDHFEIANADLAISFVTTSCPLSTYALGVAQSSLVPSIILAVSDYPLNENVPHEYQRRLLPQKNVTEAIKIVDQQVELFEEDFIEIDTEGKADKYADELSSVGSFQGHYTKDLRTQIIKEVVMGDKYEAGQVGALGPNAHAHDMTFNQIWNQSKEALDLKSLVGELQMLRDEMQKEAKAPEQFVELGSIATAEIEAKNGNGPKALAALAKAGKWTLDVAEKVGVGVAVAAIKTACSI
jgi:hypothetical protein